MPYYAWRRMRPTQREPNYRRRRDGEPLRRSEEVIHLGTRNQTENGDVKDYIHEAQISVMVTGIDDWFWTAYCFVDIYFKDDEHSERVEQYVTPPMKMDPLCGGKFTLDRPIWNPRHYFLRTLSCRMEQVKQEWNNVVFQLFQDIEPCVSNLFRSPSLSTACCHSSICCQCFNLLQDIFIY